MKIIIFSVVFFTVLCHGTANPDVDDLVIDEVVRIGEVPDFMPEGTELDREKILKENGLDNLDPSLWAEFRALVFLMYNKSEEL